jgi:hypothetical protein
MKTPKFDLMDEIREALRGAREYMDSLRERNDGSAAVAGESQVPKRSSRRSTKADSRPASAS